MSIQILSSGATPARKLTDAIPSFSSSLSDKRRSTLPAAYVRLLYVQTPSNRRKKQLASDILWNTEEGQTWRRQTAQYLWDRSPHLRGGRTPMQVLRLLWPTFSESQLFEAARSALGDDPRRAGRKVFDMKWAGFENALRGLFFREGETYQQAMQRLDAPTSDLAQIACAGQMFSGHSDCLIREARRLRREEYDGALRSQQIELERSRQRTASNQEMARQLDLALLELGRLTDQVVVGGGAGDITSDEAVTFIPEEDNAPVAADDAAIEETQKRKKVIRNVAIGTAALAGAGAAAFYLLRK